jgi:hypothetical protein
MTALPFPCPSARLVETRHIFDKIWRWEGRRLFYERKEEHDKMSAGWFNGPSLLHDADAAVFKEKIWNPSQRRPLLPKMLLRRKLSHLSCIGGKMELP